MVFQASPIVSNRRHSVDGSIDEHQRWNTETRFLGEALHDGIENVVDLASKLWWDVRM
jgi:hypothetical protein